MLHKFLSGDSPNNEELGAVPLHMVGLLQDLAHSGYKNQSTYVVDLHLN